MTDKSNFFRVTPQIMLEYRCPQKDINAYPDTEHTPESADLSRYYTYRGLDGDLYYAEDYRYTTGDNFYKNQGLYQKFPDESKSSYYYIDPLQNESSELSQYKLLTKLFTNEQSYLKDLTRIRKSASSPIGECDIDRTEETLDFFYDKLNIYLLRGFNFDTLIGITIRVRAASSVKYVDDDRSWTESQDVNFLDIFIPKEYLSASSDEHNAVAIHYLKTPLYMNSKFYDRYLTVEFPSPYSVGMYDNKNNNPVIVESTVDEDGTETQNLFRVNLNENIFLEFATVQEGNEDLSFNKTLSIDGTTYKIRKFVLDTIDEGSISLQSNTDYFNVRMYEDPSDKTIVYYPVYGDSDSGAQIELDANVMMQINSGAIPIIANGFYDLVSTDSNRSTIDNENDGLYYADKEDTVLNKWKIYNELDAGYQVGTSDEFYCEAYSRVIDYESSSSSGINFWRSKFIPDRNVIETLSSSKICLKYTCRLVNEMLGAEAIRVATLVINAPNYSTSIADRLYVNTYKIVNHIENSKHGVVVQNDVIKEKYIRSYYNATELVAKNLGTGGNIYSQGQMTLRLNRTNNNYLVQLFRINDDNVRVPYDLTGPYRYKMVFPVGDGSQTISISPNTDNKSQNLGIGTLVFYITGEQATQIMQVPADKRYFAIMTDISTSAAQETTLYEGKVAWLS